MSDSSSSSSGVGFFGLLTVLFIGLKLTNVITWSWWLVMLPLYGPALLVLTVFIVTLIIVSRAD
jgi:hypothetical protein